MKLAEFPPSLWAVCSVAGLFCYGKSLKFPVVPVVDSRDIVELLEYYCLLTTSLTRPRSWSVRPMFYCQSAVIARHSLAPQERRDSKSAKSTNQRLRGLKGLLQLPGIQSSCSMRYVDNVTLILDKGQILASARYFFLFQESWMCINASREIGSSSHTKQKTPRNHITKMAESKVLQRKWKDLKT